MTLVEPEAFVKTAQAAGVGFTRDQFWDSEKKCGCYAAVALYLKSPELLEMRRSLGGYHLVCRKALDLTDLQLDSIEAGFEGWLHRTDIDQEYFDYGAAIAKAAGLV